MTLLLCDLVGGDREVVQRILPLVYEDLHALAAACLRRERPEHTLQPTALVHEAYLRLVDQRNTGWKDRAHFLAIASQAMRRVLVDHARARARDKRGGNQDRAAIDLEALTLESPAEDILALDDALTRLGVVNAQAARVVEVRYFAGLDVESTAEILGVSASTVARLWRYARAWLHCELSGVAGSVADGAGEEGHADRP